MTRATVPTRGQPQWTVTAADDGPRLDRFLAAPDRLGSRGRAAEALRRGKVFLNDVEADAGSASARLQPGDVVRVWMDRPGSASRRASAFSSAGLSIVYEDDLIIVIDKPAGLLTVPLPQRPGAPSVHGQLAEHLRSQRHTHPLIVHRIDRDTSGLVLFAKSTRAQQDLKQQFRRHEPERVYLALVHGHPTPRSGTWRDRLVWDDGAMKQRKARPSDPRVADAVCEYTVVEQLERTSLLEVRLHTGKQNQIRIQAQLRGHPLVGERRYVTESEDEDGEPGEPIEFSRQALHAHRLSFRHPGTGRAVTFEAPLPRDFAKLLGRLRQA